jgi:predicted hotdog family 3-hydroxylacyl-ACP dehydratase
MILIEEVFETTPEGLTATVRIGEDSQFFESPRGVPTFAGIEYIAQTVAALAGLRAKRAGEDVRLGFLLGTRRLDASQPYFPLGAKLTVNVKPEFESAELAKFEGEIADEDGNVIVKSAVTVYLNADAPEQGEQGRQ